MTSKLVPSDPGSVSVIRAVTDSITTISAPFSRFGRIRIGSRATIVKLTNGSLAVFSPSALTPAVKERVRELGSSVRYIAAPDFEHHIFLGEWKTAYPEAKVIGVEGLAEKRKGMKDEDLPGGQVPFAVEFTEKTKATTKIDDAFDADFDYEYVGAHGNKELVFCFKPERTLIEADLLFNLPAIEQYSLSKENPHTGIFTKIFNYLQHTRGDAMAQRRVIWYGLSQDKPAFAASMARINAWDFDRIIPCHGDVIETGGKSVFRKVMAWHLEGQQK